jgi:hypothetical protein
MTRSTRIGPLFNPLEPTEPSSEAQIPTQPPRPSSRTRTVIPDEAKQKICDLYKEWKNVRRVAVQLGYSRKNLLPVLVQAGLYSQPKRGYGIDGSKISRDERRKQQREQWLKAGACIYCGDPVCDNSTVMCEHHYACDQRRRESKAPNNKCNNCGKLRMPGRAHCEACFRKIKAKATALQASRKDAGLCVLCGKNPAANQRVLCEDCRQKTNEAIMGKKRARASKGLCSGCGKHPCLSASPLCEICYFKQSSCTIFGTRAEWEELRRLFHEAGARCPYSGLPLVLGENAAIDHRVPVTKGGPTTIANLQWIHQVSNQMKWNYSEEEFLEMIRAIYEFRVRPTP